MRACWGYGLHKLPETIVEWFWESQPERVKAPYTKSRPDGRFRVPRDTWNLVEVGGITPKAKYSLVTDSA